jgi:hypothetical protein
VKGSKRDNDEQNGILTRKIDDYEKKGIIMRKRDNDEKKKDND